MTDNGPIIEVKNLSKRYGPNEVLRDVTLTLHPGQVLCLLGDNGAGKSTLIKLISGVEQPTSGLIHVHGEARALASPKDARDLGIATVHQVDETCPLLSISRNFFLGAEMTRGRAPFRALKIHQANEIALQELRELGLTRIRDADQLVGSLSGGERQVMTIARAMYFGARVLILDEPTSALGVKEADLVLRMISQVTSRGVAVIFITHNATHALAVGGSFMALVHGRVADAWLRGERTREEVLNLMAGVDEFGTTGA